MLGKLGRRMNYAIPERFVVGLLELRDLWAVLRYIFYYRCYFARRPPVTLNEKIRYKMVFDRRPILTTFADKLAVREYVACRVGSHVLNEIYQVVDDPREIDFAALPERFVVKPTHGSAAVIIVHDRAAETAQIPTVPVYGSWQRLTTWVRKDRLDIARFNALCDHWLMRKYCQYEWAYRHVKPRLIVERFLESPDGALPRDYKLRVMHGKVRWLGAHVDKAEAQTLSLHWPDWTQIPASGLYPRPATPPRRPETLEEMIAVAEALGVDTDMVRVDLYEVGGKVVFGELTNYPAGGTAPFSPPEYATILAEGWNPPRRYRNTRPSKRSK